MRNKSLNEVIASAEATGHLAYGVEDYLIDSYRNELVDSIDGSTFTDYRLNFARGAAIDSKYGIYDDLVIHDTVEKGGYLQPVDRQVDIFTKTKLLFNDDEGKVDIIEKYMENEEVHHKYITQGQLEEAYESNDIEDYDGLRRIVNSRGNLDLATDAGHLNREDFHNGNYTNTMYDDYEDGLRSMQLNMQDDQLAKEDIIEDNTSFLVHAMLYAFGDLIKNRNEDMSVLQKSESLIYAGLKGIAVYHIADIIEDVLSDIFEDRILHTLFDDSIGNILVGKGLIDIGEALLHGDATKAKEKFGMTIRKSGIRYGADFAIRELFATSLMSNLIVDLNLTWLDPTYVTTVILMSFSLLSVGYKSIDNIKLVQDIERITHEFYYDRAKEDVFGER